MAKNPLANAGDTGLIPGPKIPHVVEQGRPPTQLLGPRFAAREVTTMRRPHAETTDSCVCLESVLYNSPLPATGQRPHAEIKTQPRQKQICTETWSNQGVCTGRSGREPPGPWAQSSSSKALSQVHRETSFMKIQVDKTFHTHVKALNVHLYLHYEVSTNMNE